MLSSFSRKAMHTKVEDNFMAHNLDSEFAFFGVHTWEIWCGQGRAANQEILDEAEFMETKFASLEDLMQGKVEHAPKLSMGINTTS
jgi:hypothetical protein